MKGITKYIPNTLTCLSLSFGVYASILGISGDYYGAMFAIFIAAVFDFLDGFAARLFNAFSPIGKDLDSLSDMVSFGVAPGMMLFSFLDSLLHSYTSLDNIGVYKLFLLSALAIPVLSALRLAKFNIDSRQKTSFIGLPVPAHAIFWASLIAALSPYYMDYHLKIDSLFSNFLSGIPLIIIVISLSALAFISSLLLVSEIPMFSLKISSFAWKTARLQYILIISAILLITFFGIIGITVTMLLYIFLSLFNPPKS